MATYYDLLGVDPHASAEEIQRAYRLLALRHHPDVAPDADQKTMAAINGAWSVLSDPARRRTYDAGLDRPEPPPRPAPPAADAVWRPLDDGEGDVDPEDLSDDPYSPVDQRPSDMLVMTPVLLILGAFALFFLSVVSGSGALRTFSMLLVPIAGIGFVMAPLIVMLRSRSRSGQ